MKRTLILIITILISGFTFSADVYAEDPTLTQVACSYNGSNSVLNIKYRYTPAAGVFLTVGSMDYTINSKSVYSYNIENEGSSIYPEEYKNLTQALMILNDDKTQYIPINYTTQGYFMQNVENAINSGTDTPLCPETFYVGKKENTYEFYACGIGENLNGNKVDYCPLTKKYVEQENTEVIELKLNDNTKVQTDSNYFNGEDSNVTDTYIKIATELEELEEQEKIYCDVNNSSYNKNTCDEITQKIIDAKSLKENVENQADLTGIDTSTLEKAFGDFKINKDLTFKGPDSCESLLGEVKYNPNLKVQEPAFYLSFAFNLIKYAAIILLFVLTIIEYAKAIASSNQDAIKKATTSTVKRLIIAAIIFFLPILIEFILKLLGVIEVNGTCGIR